MPQAIGGLGVAVVGSAGNESRWSFLGDGDQIIIEEYSQLCYGLRQLNKANCEVSTTKLIIRNLNEGLAEFLSLRVG